MDTYIVLVSPYKVLIVLAITIILYWEIIRIILP